MPDERTIQELKDAFTKAPFYAVKVAVGSLDGDLNRVADFFDLSDAARTKLKRSRKLTKRTEIGETIELEYPDTRQRLTLVVMPIGKRRVLAWLKKDVVDPEEKYRNYGVDQHCLRVARLVIDNILQKSYRRVSVIGWIDSIKGNSAKFFYYDEMGNLVHGEADRGRFSKVSDLREGSQFIIQTWEEGNMPKVDFVPMSALTKEQLRRGIRNLLELAKHGIAKTELERAGWPKRPRDWSDQREIEQYVKEWGEKFKGINFRGRKKNDGDFRTGV